MINQKTTAVRIIPAPGKGVGDQVVFGGLLGEAPIIPVHKESSKAFIDRGGHQLQLNSVNRETLVDAQAHPENYPNLIVRVWGWSGYFVELDRVYQDHVIARTEFGV